MNETKNITDAMSKRGINWHFDPPSASHQNGATEIAFLLFRKCFHAAIGDTILNCEIFRTAMADICNTLNQRPLIPISPDSDSLQVFSPSSLLGGCLTSALMSMELSQADELWKL